MDCTICANERWPARGNLTSGRSSNRCQSARKMSRLSALEMPRFGGCPARGAERPVPCEGRTCETDPDVRETQVRTCMSATAHVVVRIVVAPRPPGRLRRAETGGRGRSDPLFSMPAVASAEVGMCTPSQPPRGSLRASDPMREGQTASRNGRVPALVGDAGQPGGQVVGQRVLQRLEATLDTLPERTVGPERPPVEDGMGVSMPILPDGTPRVQGGGLLRSQPHHPARHERPGSHRANHNAANDI